MDKIPAEETVAKKSLSKEAISKKTKASIAKGIRVSNGSGSDVNEARANTNFLSKTIYFLWHFHKKLVISVIVLLALLLLGLRISALYIESHPERIEELIERSTGSKIRFSEIDVDINPLFPAILLKDIAIINESETENLLKFGQIKIELNVWRSIWQGQPIVEAFKLEGISTIIRRDTNGQFFIGDLSLFDRKADNRDELNFSKGFLSFLAQPGIQITNSEFYIVDQLNIIPSMLFHDINIKLQNQGDRHQIAAETSLNNTSTRLDVRLDFNGDIQSINKWDGNVYLALEAIKADNFLHLLGENVLQVENFRVMDFDLSTQLWASISQGLLQTIQGEMSIKNANLYREGEDISLLFDELSTNIHIERGLLSASDNDKHPQQSGDWNIDLNNINCEVGANQLTLQRINVQYMASRECAECKLKSDIERSSPRLQVYIDSLDFARAAPLVHFFSPLEFHEQLYQLIKPRGQVKDSYAVLTLESLAMPINITAYQLQTSLRQFGLNAMHKIPEVGNFSADILLNNQSGIVEIDSHDLKLHVSALFRDAWPITDLTGTFEWQKDASDWLLQGKNLSVGNAHLKADADVKLWIPAAGSKRDIFMDLSVYYHDANLEYVSLYLPVEIMKDGLVHWLDNAIVAGIGTDGGAVYRGRFGGFPYNDYSGQMDIVFNAKDAVLDYMQGWPKLEHMQSRIQFTGQGMRAESSYSKILGAVSNNAKVTIEDFKKPVLRVVGDLTGKVSDGRAFLKQSLLASEAVLEVIEGEGNIGINLDLSKPLKKTGADTRIKVSLKDVQYFPPYLKKKKGLVDKLSGEIIVHNKSKSKSISSNKLRARIMGQPAQVKISTTMPAQSKEPRVNIRVDSRTSVQKLSEYEILPEWINPALSYINGQTGVSLDINLPYQGKTTRVNVSSNLKGLSSQLPLPLEKKAAELKKLKLSFSLEQNHKVQLKLDYASQIFSALLLNTIPEPDKLIKAHIHFGKGNAALPKPAEILLTGVIDGIDSDAWGSLFASEGKSQAGKKAQAGKKSGGTKSSFPVPVQLSLSKLVLPDLFKHESAASETPGEAKKQVSKIEQDFIKPAEFPTINGTIKQLYAGDVLLGQADIKSVRLKKSIHFERLAVAGDLLDFKGNAIWNQWQGEPRFNMDGELHIPSLERALGAFGFNEFIKGAETNLSGSVGWPGGPMDFSREKIDGKINISFHKGRILSAKSGATENLLGLLNLLNMNEIFRRITFDFSDVSERGLEFNTISGDFSFSEGNAFTENYVLDAPSIIIANSGRLGLVKQDMDMTIIVIPDVSGTLPLAGAAVAGPAGAAVVWIGQKILGDKINQITALKYKVTGSWDNPQIKKQKLGNNTLEIIKNISGYDKLKEVRDGFLDSE
jgi:uncharacterized protein YhdP